MKVILANPRGFCAGVNMAIGSLERALELFGAPIYVYHEIVHNRRVVDGFRRRGVVFVEDLESVPEGSTLLYSAHGVSPEIHRKAAQRGLRTIDATCPLVRKVHREAVRYVEAGNPVVLVGHAGHDEVEGVLGTAPQKIHLVETVEDIDYLELDDDAEVAFLTQTTLSVDDTATILEQLRQRFPALKGPDAGDICYATQNRQEAVKLLVPQADVVLVLGSRNSSNSNRLAEIARAHGVPAYLIDGAGEIDPAWFTGKETVLMTAGASAPKEVIDECLAYLTEHFNAEIDEQVIRVESARFPLPRELQVETTGSVMALPAAAALEPAGVLT